MACTLLMTNEDVPDLLRVEERVVDRQNRTTRNTEYSVDLELLEGSDLDWAPLTRSGASWRRLPVCVAAAAVVGLAAPDLRGVG